MTQAQWLKAARVLRTRAENRLNEEFAAHRAGEEILQKKDEREKKKYISLHTKELATFLQFQKGPARELLAASRSDLLRLCEDSDGAEYWGVGLRAGGYVFFRGSSSGFGSYKEEIIEPDEALWIVHKKGKEPNVVIQEVRARLDEVSASVLQ